MWVKPKVVSIYEQIEAVEATSLRLLLLGGPLVETGIIPKQASLLATGIYAGLRKLEANSRTQVDLLFLLYRLFTSISNRFHL